MRRAPLAPLAALAWLTCAACAYWAVDAVRYATGWRASRSMGDVGAYVGAWVLPLLALLAGAAALRLTRAARRARPPAAAPPS